MIERENLEDFPRIKSLLPEDREEVILTSDEKFNQHLFDMLRKKGKSKFIKISYKKIMHSTSYTLLCITILLEHTVGTFCGA